VAEEVVEVVIIEEVQAIVVTPTPVPPTPVPPTPVPPTPTFVAEVLPARLPSAGAGAEGSASNSALIIGLTFLALGSLLFAAGNLRRRGA
jgi:hypothetical protein